MFAKYKCFFSIWRKGRLCGLIAVLTGICFVMAFQSCNKGRENPLRDGGITYVVETIGKANISQGEKPFMREWPVEIWLSHYPPEEVFKGDVRLSSLGWLEITGQGNDWFALDVTEILEPFDSMSFTSVVITPDSLIGHVGLGGRLIDTASFDFKAVIKK